MCDRSLDGNFFDCSVFNDNKTWKSDVWRSKCTQSEQNNCSAFNQISCNKYANVCFWDNNTKGECIYRKAFTISFDTNGGKCDNDCYDVTKDNNETIDLPKNVIKKGHTFGG